MPEPAWRRAAPWGRPNQRAQRACACRHEMMVYTNACRGGARAWLLAGSAHALTKVEPAQPLWQFVLRERAREGIQRQAVVGDGRREGYRVGEGPPNRIALNPKMLQRVRQQVASCRYTCVGAVMRSRSGGAWQTNCHPTIAAQQQPPPFQQACGRSEAHVQALTTKSPSRHPSRSGECWQYRGQAGSRPRPAPPRPARNAAAARCGIPAHLVGWCPPAP